MLIVVSKTEQYLSDGFKSTLHCKTNGIIVLMADPRHIKRMKMVQNLFAQMFYPEQSNIPEEDADVSDISKHVEEIDRTITKHAPRYPLDRIAKIDLCILRLAIYELMYEKKEPPKVVIDEAVTLAREFGGERSYAFINAVLGAVYSDNFEQPTNE